MNDLEWLAGWYGSQADGEWEHEFGVVIDTLDNPGWSMKVDLDGTVLSTVPFEAEADERTDGWHRFWKDEEAGVFHAVGDETALPTLIARFRRWAETIQP